MTIVQNLQRCGTCCHLDAVSHIHDRLHRDGVAYGKGQVKPWRRVIQIDVVDVGYSRTQYRGAVDASLVKLNRVGPAATRHRLAGRELGHRVDNECVGAATATQVVQAQAAGNSVCARTASDDVVAAAACDCVATTTIDANERHVHSDTGHDDGAA